MEKNKMIIFVKAVLHIIGALFCLIIFAEPSAIAATPIPSLDDEKNTYRLWGWTWDSSAEPNYSSAPGYTVSEPDIHGDTEADDLWTYLMMYRRTSQTGYLDRAKAWARYFKEDYRNCVSSNYYWSFCYDKDFLYDHMYGWGLVDWYIFILDTTALQEAENLAAEVENFYTNKNPGDDIISTYGPRGGARHLLLVTKVAEATSKQRWISLRDKLINMWLQTPDWDAARGMYFVGSWQTDYRWGSGSYASGIRVQCSFQLAILSEALYQAYRTSGRTELRDRMIAIARFVNKFGIDPTLGYTSSWFALDTKTNTSIHNGNGGWGMGSYTTSFVNTLVLGYKFTGDKSLLERAKYFFNRGTKFSSLTERAAADNVVHHFVDTIFDSSSGNFYLAYNKGELQYTYLLFENGGNPIIEGITPPPADSLPPSRPTNLRIY